MARATRAETKERISLCARALAQGLSETRIVSLLVEQYGISDRQAWRNLRQTKAEVKRLGIEMTDYEAGLRIKQAEILADQLYRQATSKEQSDEKSLKASFSLIRGVMDLRKNLSKPGGDKKKNDTNHIDQSVEAAGLADLIQSLASEKAAG